MDERQKFIDEFRDRATKFAEGVYTLRLTQPVDMEYRMCCEAIDVADEMFPPDEEGNVTPQWAQIKNSFITIVEKVIATKAQRKDIL